MNYFGFIDETGINLNDRFFGIGILTIPDVSEIYDKLRPISDEIKSLARDNKNQRLEKLYDEKNFKELLDLSKGSKTFELKYDRISLTNQNLFIKLIKAFFTVKTARFTAIIVDKKNPSYKPTKVFPGTWEAYITYSCLAIMREHKNLNPSSFITILDEISKEREVKDSLEVAIINKFKANCLKKGIKAGNLITSRAESNSHILIQIVDVLLGCVAFDYKYRNKLVTKSLYDRKFPVVKEILTQLSRDDLNGDFTSHKPSYFSVWEINWK